MQAKWLLKDVHTLIPGTCECITLHDKRDFADVIKVDYPGLSEWVPYEAREM